MRLIDADALIRQIESPYTEYAVMIQIRRALKEFINSAPSIEPKRGEWIRTERMGTFKLYDCSVCGIHIEAPWNFCPNCGARMKGEHDERSNSETNK